TELADIGMRRYQWRKPDVAARVVVHADQGGVDRVDPFLDQLGLFVEPRLEARDVPDRVLVEVSLELLGEPGKVVIDQALVQLPVPVRRLNRVAELVRLNRVLAAELAHRADHRGSQAVYPAIPPA